jgi:hypothetical protein
MSKSVRIYTKKKIRNTSDVLVGTLDVRHQPENTEIKIKMTSREFL